jgi:hypothetical protein
MISSDYSQLAETALSLPETARAELAALLLHSLDNHLPPSQRRTATQWASELQRRSDVLNHGTAVLFDAEEALAQARSAVNANSGQE